MILPGRDVPEGLNGDEYFKLSIQYLLMGWKKQMVVAAKKAMDSGSLKLGRLNESFSEDDCKRLGLMLGIVEGTMELGEEVGDMVQSALVAFKEATGYAEKVIDDLELKDVREEIQNAFVSFSNEASKFFGKAVEDVLFPIVGLPTRDLAQGRSAEEYLDMATQYHMMGWAEQARDALLLAQEIDPENVGPKAMKFLKAKIPRHPVPHHAIQKNIVGKGQLLRGDLEAARKTFSELVEKYPDFEWPFVSLGSVYIQQGKLNNAAVILNRALDINDGYVNAWVQLARARAVVLDTREAQSCIDRALKADPDEPSVQSLKTIIDMLSAL